MDLEDQQYLLKKLWCHGQLFAPIQGVMILLWSFKEPLEGAEFIYCFLAALVLGSWSYLSWRSMNKLWPPPPVLIRAGLVLEGYYIGIIYITSHFVSTSVFALMVLMFTCLQIMETGAYLAMVGCLRDSLTTQDSPNRGSRNNRDGIEMESFI